jgi:hypothetical protein
MWGGSVKKLIVNINMAFSITFGNSSMSSSMANWGFILLMMAVFLFFTGLWQSISNKWASFFGSGLWSRTIGNAKGTWNSIQPTPPPPQVGGVNAPPPAPIAPSPVPIASGGSGSTPPPPLPGISPYIEQPPVQALPSVAPSAAFMPY